MGSVLKVPGLWLICVVSLSLSCTRSCLASLFRFRINDFVCAGIWDSTLKKIKKIKLGCVGYVYIHIHTWEWWIKRKKKKRKKKFCIASMVKTQSKKKKAKGESVGRCLYARNKCIKKILQLLATVLYIYVHKSFTSQPKKKAKNCFYGSRCCSRQAPATAASRFHVRCIISTPSLRPSLSTF